MGAPESKPVSKPEPKEYTFGDKISLESLDFTKPIVFI